MTAKHLLILTLALLVGCGGSTGGGVGGGGGNGSGGGGGSTVTITAITGPSNEQVGSAETYQYTCTVSSGACSWASSNSAIVAINATTGIATPSATTGTVTITATATADTTVSLGKQVNVTNLADWILYQNAGQVMMMNSDGSNQVSLLPKTAGCEYVTWSHDHLKFICSNSLTPAPVEFFIYSTDGTPSGTKELSAISLDQIGGLDTANFPHFSPDGKTIVFMGIKPTTVGSTNEDIEGIWTIGSDGTGLIERATEPYGDGVLIENPRFNPDGTILYQKGHNVWLMNGDGSNAHQLVNTSSYMAIFSPDMKKLYYNTEVGAFMAAADGTNPVQISSSSRLIWGVSPNGASIAFWDLSVDTGNVITANADGSNQKNIAVGGGPVW